MTMGPPFLDPWSHVVFWEGNLSSCALRVDEFGLTSPVEFVGMVFGVGPICCWRLGNIRGIMWVFGPTQE